MVLRQQWPQGADLRPCCGARPAGWLHNVIVWSRGFSLSRCEIKQNNKCGWYQRICSIPPVCESDSGGGFNYTFRVSQTLLLMDHNSILTPGVDTQFVRGEEVLGVQSARGAEVEALRKMAMVDGWDLVHAGTATPPPQYTFGQTVQGPKRNVRRIDRVHVPEAMTPSVAGAYTILTGSDHRGVVIQLAAPSVEVGRPRQKFPEAMLADEVPMLRL